VSPEECSSFQKWLEGCAYAWPWSAVLTPGLVPTKTHIRFGSRMSTSGERWAYFEGSAYLLAVRCFFAGRGDEVVVAVAAWGVTLDVVRERLADRAGDVVTGESFSLVEPLAY